MTLRSEYCLSLLLLIVALSGCSLEKYRQPIQNFSEKTTILTEEVTSSVTNANQAFRNAKYGSLKGPGSRYPTSAQFVYRASQVKTPSARDSQTVGSIEKQPIISAPPVPASAIGATTEGLAAIAQLANTLGNLAKDGSADAHFAAQVSSLTSLLGSLGGVLDSIEVERFGSTHLATEFSNLGAQFKAVSGLLGAIGEAIGNGRREHAILEAAQKAVPEVEKMILPIAMILNESSNLEKQYLEERLDTLGELLKEDGRLRGDLSVRQLAMLNSSLESLPDKPDMADLIGFAKLIGAAIGHPFGEVSGVNSAILTQRYKDLKVRIAEIDADPELSGLQKDRETEEEFLLFASVLNSVAPSGTMNLSEQKVVQVEIEELNKAISELDDVKRPLRRKAVQDFVKAINSFRNVAGMKPRELSDDEINVLNQLSKP